MLDRLSGSTILIVEDELLIALDIQVALEDAGARTLVVGSVSEALALLGDLATPPDSAVLDVRLGAEEVFPVADVLAEHGVPIVFHSGHARAIDLAQHYPRASVLPKPAPPERLVAALAAPIPSGTDAASA